MVDKLRLEIDAKLGPASHPRNGCLDLESQTEKPTGPSSGFLTESESDAGITARSRGGMRRALPPIGARMLGTPPPEPNAFSVRDLHDGHAPILDIGQQRTPSSSFRFGHEREATHQSKGAAPRMPSPPNACQRSASSLLNRVETPWNRNDRAGTLMPQAHARGQRS